MYKTAHVNVGKTYYTLNLYGKPSISAAAPLTVIKPMRKVLFASI